MSESTPSLPLTWKELGAILNVDPAQLHRESKRPGFPSSATLDSVRNWRAANIRPRERKNKTALEVSQPNLPNPPQAPPRTPTVAASSSAAIGDGLRTAIDEYTLEPLANADDPFILDLMSGTASPLSLTKAAMQMASRRVAKAAVKGTLSANDLDGLKKTLQELRQSEEAYINLEVSKKNLMQRDDTEMVIGQAVARLLVCLETVTNTIATELSLWLTDPAVAALNQDDRARKVREFVGKVCRDVRSMEADGVGKMIAAIGMES